MTDSIEKTTDIAAPIERVWRALTDHEAFGQWFGVAVEGPFAVGQPSRGHITYPGYEHVDWDAIVEWMEPPTRFAFRWHPYAVERGVDYSAEPRTRVEFTLEPIATGTRLTVVETGFDALPAHRRADCLRMNDSGWAEQMVSIRNHVEG
jgi:uncharacterized protein YndB with AHSA1/START domain